MTSPERVRPRAGRNLAAFSVVAGAGSMALIAALGEHEMFIDTFVLHNGILAVALGILVWVSMPTQGRNKSVWALLSAAFFSALFCAGFAGLRLLSPSSLFEQPIQDIATLSPSDLSFTAALAFNPAAWAWIPGLFSILTVGLIYFPDGRPPSPRWNWLAWYSITTIAVPTTLFAWLQRPSSTAEIGDLAGTAGTIGSVAEASVMLPLTAVPVSVSALFFKYQRSSEETRRQIRWIGWGGSFLAVIVITTLVIDGTAGTGSSLTGYAALIGEVLFVGCFVIAIRRYRLYQIDIVISKTVVYGLLAAFIAVVYVGVVVGVGALLGQGQDASFGLSIVATALVALAFQPVRRRVERWANRLVYGERATPYQVLSDFSHRAVEVAETELIERVPKLIVDGTGAAEATLWVRTDDGFRPRASFPVGSSRNSLGIREPHFEDPKADHSLPVFHDGELLGGISVRMGRGEAITPTEHALLQNLASGLGLAMRNVRLTERLRDQVASLEASRDRILAAADEARRALELDLDSGPLQQLVALKVKLGPVRLQAEQRGALKTANVIAQLEDDAGKALQAVRDFAGGIYPPLLEAEGLSAAISQETRQAPIPVALDARSLSRYHRDVEAAVYFSVLEALQNSVKYSEATSIIVTLSDQDGELAFTISDDGVGFDLDDVEMGAGLDNMSDRIDAIGGVVTIDSSVGNGTTVRGSVPLHQFEPA